ncbi:hypothetical protein NECAME_10384 [Necator americanus]|uniref:Uncharacterized protein n=1 Tax=Necator americanus TaxID=51031 RepID=W2TBL6_NECAM|nr:hypothetical protein NECAME_10384 [Necator americanus]ETN78387.1 hypothetical protein NECAME_10384 [Necator americanus]
MVYFLQECETACYGRRLDQVRVQCQGRRRDCPICECWLIFYDYTGPHTPDATQQKMVKMGLKTLDHSPYRHVISTCLDPSKERLEASLLKEESLKKEKENFTHSQALRGVCHLRFPFERPLARYDTLQMWPDEERPIWYNKFLKNFMTIGPTMIIPCGIASKKPASLLQGCEGISPVSPAVLFPERRYGEEAGEKRKAKMLPESSLSSPGNGRELSSEGVFQCYTFVDLWQSPMLTESASGHFCSSTKTVGTLQKAASFGMIKAIPFTTSRNPLPAHVKLEAQTVIKEQSYELDSLMKPWCREIAIQDLSCDLSLYPPPDSLSHNSAPFPPGTCEAEDHEFTVYEPSREFYPSPSLLRQESLQLPKSEFSVDNRSVEPEEVCKSGRNYKWKKVGTNINRC